MELSKYIKSESVEVKRSTIHFASYNPRTLSEDEKKTIKRGIKKFGLVGGLVVNKRTGMTVVSGHQRLTVMDELNKFPEQDYIIRVDLIDVDDKQEKELNILLNNPNAQGKWDYDALAKMVPDIDFDSAGFDEFDLESLGLDMPSLQEVEEIVDNTPVWSEDTEENQMRRKVDTAFNKDRVAREKDEDDRGAESYVCLTFSNRKAKESFMIKFGFDVGEQFIKGEEFSEIIERID